MSIFEAIALGIVQGFTEFLPVSSSGHLVLLQKIFGVQGDVLFFDTMLHVGTLVAVIAVLWQEVAAILRHPVQKLTGLLIVATIPAVVAALLFEDFIEHTFGGGFLGYAFLLTAALLVFTELFVARRPQRRYDRRGGRELGYGGALFVGCMQAVAVLPGVSRSGSTLAGSLLTGMNREKAAHFAFLMSIPVILGSVVFQSFDLVTEGIGDTSLIFPTVVGTVFAAVSGFFAVKFMLNLVKKRRLYGFAIYTGVLGALVLIDQWLTHLVF